MDDRNSEYPLTCSNFFEEAASFHKGLGILRGLSAGRLSSASYICVPIRIISPKEKLVPPCPHPHKRGISVRIVKINRISERVYHEELVWRIHMQNRMIRLRGRYRWTAWNEWRNYIFLLLIRRLISG